MRGKILQSYWLFFAGIIAFHWPSTIYAAGNPAIPSEREILTIPVAVYILDTIDNTNDLSSRRNATYIDNHLLHVNEIWKQADIVIKPLTIERVKVPGNILTGLIHKRGRGGIAHFVRGIRRNPISTDVFANKSLIKLFFVRTLGGPNGLAAMTLNSVFVVDHPANDDFRVTSHEIGHLLGLKHTSSNPNLLLFPGSSGAVLTAVEQIVARYNAEKMLAVTN